MAAMLLCSLSSSPGQTTDVSGLVQVEVRGQQKTAKSLSGAVVWLVPERGAQKASFVPAPAGHFRLVQKDKSFSPHLLVIPLGSSVEFPNMDPFFHNVFSLFNGKRFDLGLYEAGSTRTVRFDHEGVSYIFCNIHPEMSAVIIALSTPYVAISGTDGRVRIQRVAAGNYEMHVWAEGADAEQLGSLTRPIHVEPDMATIGVIHIVKDAEALTRHKNKFGEDYKPYDSPLYSYR